MALVSMAGSAQDFKANMDPSVKAGDDFWQYAVGSWLKANPLDKQHPENGAFTDLSELNNDRINALIMKYADQKNLPQGSDGQKIGAVYRLYMDSVGRNKLGYQPILPYLKQVRGLKTREELLKLMYELDGKGFNTAPFGIGLSLNPFKSSEYMMSAGHGGTSLAQEYYAEPNETQKKTVEAIKSLNKDYFKMVGYNDADAERMMQAEWAIEHKIGVKTLNQVARRNPMLTIHIMSWEQLLKDFKGIDWAAYRDAIGYPQDINGRNIADFVWTDYLRLFWDRGSYDNGNFVPLLCPFWYIRNLLILSLISPIIYFLNRYLRERYILAIIIWWILTPHNAFIPQSILFFSLGAFFSIQDKNPLSLFIQHKTLFISLCLLLAGADIITHTAFPTAINLQIHRFALIANIPVLFLLAHHITTKEKLSPAASYLSNSAFIVFSIHYPIVVMLPPTVTLLSVVFSLNEKSPTAVTVLPSSFSGTVSVFALPVYSVITIVPSSSVSYL